MTLCICSVVLISFFALSTSGGNETNSSPSERPSYETESDQNGDIDIEATASDSTAEHASDASATTILGEPSIADSADTDSGGPNADTANSSSQEPDNTSGQTPAQGASDSTSTTANPIGPDSPQANSPTPISVQPPTTTSPTTSTTEPDLPSPVTCAVGAIIIDAGEEIDPAERKVLVSVDVESASQVQAVWTKISWADQTRNAMIQISPSGVGTFLVPAPGSAPITAAIFVDPDFASVNQRCSTVAR